MILDSIVEKKKERLKTEMQQVTLEGWKQKLKGSGLHKPLDFGRALEAGAKIIGINNRNLETFEVDLATTERLINWIPRDRIVVSESGIKTVEDMKYLKSVGADAVLIGESFMRVPSAFDKIEEFRLA